MNLLRPILIGAFAFFAIGLNAQTEPTSNNAVAQYSQENTNQLATDLGLNADQVAQIQNLNEKVIGKIQAIQNNAEMTDAKKREFIRGNKEDHKRVMSTILTPQQFDAYLDSLKPKAADQRKQALPKKTN